MSKAQKDSLTAAELIRSKRTPEAIQAEIERLVSVAPPLSDEQKRRLGNLLGDAS